MTEVSRNSPRLSAAAGCLSVSGALDSAAVAGLYESGREHIREAAGASLILDLSQVDGSDSSGLALLIDWLRTARENSVQLQFRAVPRQLRDIAGLCGLSEFFDSMTHAN